MSGCVLPVVINSGSGNQGMTASLPVIKYAQHIGATREQLYRALVLSNLIAIHQKRASAASPPTAGRSARQWAAGQQSPTSTAAPTSRLRYDHQHDRQCFRHCVRRRETLLRGQNCLRSGCGDPRPLHGAAKPQLPARRRNCPRRCGGYHPGRWPDWARWNARNGRGNFEYYSGED